MSGERFVALGLAHVRSAWFRDLSRWATAAALPVEFVKCVSVEELRARLAGARAFSAVIVDSGVPGVDRDLLEVARQAGCAVVVVDDGRGHRDWQALGASAVLAPDFGRAELLDALEANARRIGRGDDVSLDPVPRTAAGTWRGRLIAVTGAGGTGASTVAMALAQGLGGDTRYGGLVLLADLALDGDQAVLHDAGDVVPGVQELVDAHRSGDPTLQDIRSLTFAVPDRQYQLLLGLRRHRDWATVRPRVFAASLDSLRRAYKAVVADITPDLEGEDQCGSIDVEERNAMARTTVATADAIVIVGLAGVKGMHRLVRLAASVVEQGVDPASVLPVVNRAPRSPRARAELTRAFAELTAPLGELGPLLQLPERRGLDDVIHDAVRLPSALTNPLAAAVAVLLERAPTRPPLLAAPEPVAVAPGSLGAALLGDDEP